MRPWLALLFLAGCTKTAIGEAAPAPRVVEDDRVPLSVPDTRRPAVATHAADTSWIASLPKARTFARVDGLAGAESIAITWRQYPQHRRPGFDGEPDYPSLFSGKVELELRGAGVVKTLSLGEEAGNVEGGVISHCERRGYRHPPGRDGYAFRHADLANRVAFWEIGTTQGSTEYLLLLGEGRIHVLHRGTHDGACPTTIAQGPLTDICEDMKWERAFEIAVHGEPRFTEAVVEVDEDGSDPTPIDCKASYSGQDLVPPGE